MDRRNKFDTKIIYLIIAIIFISTLSFGSVEVWSFSLVGLYLLTLFVIWTIIRCRKDRNYKNNSEIFIDSNLKLTFFVCFLPLYAIVQVIPLPTEMIKIISPKTYELYNFYSFTKRNFIPISLNPYRTFLFMQQMLYGISVFIPVYFLTQNKAMVERNIKIFSIFGFALSFFALLQMATWNGKIYWFREVTSGSPFGPFINRNHYAGFIDMLIPATLGISFTKKRKEKQLLFGFFAVIMAVSVFVSLSRAGIISFIISLTVFSLFLVYEKFRYNKKIAVAIFLLVLVTYLIYLGVDPIIERFYRTDLTREERFTIWSATYKGVQDFILTGSGFGTFLNVLPLYLSKPSTIIYDHAHNDYIEFLIEGGIIGVVLLIMFFYLYIKHTIKGMWKGEWGIIRISLASSIISILIHSMFDFNLHITSNVLLLSYIMATFAASSKINYE